MINLKIIYSENTDQNETCRFKVNINDKVAKLGNLAGASGQFIFNNKVIEEPENKSFVQMFICDDDKIVLTCKGEGGE